MDKDRKSNTWFEVTYKRAVDKTSQGLRERERDDDNTTVSADSKPIIMPPPERTGSTTLGMISQQPPQQQQQQQSVLGASITPKKTSFAVNLETTLQPQPTNPNHVGMGAVSTGTTVGVLKKRTNPAYGASVHYGDSESKVKRMRAESPTTEEEDLAPLPPTLQQRESSMFRLLTNTKLLFAHGETPGALPGQHQQSQQSQPATNPRSGMSQYPTKLNNLGNPNQVNTVTRGKGSLLQLNRMSKQQPSLAKETQEARHQSDLKKMQEEAFRQQLLGQQQQQQMFLGQASLFNAQQQSIVPPMATTMGTQPAVPEPAPQPTPVGSAPALTRLTSQMSDWLTSFFPVATRGESIANFGARGESIANFKPVAANNEGAGNHNSMVANGSHGQQNRQQAATGGPQLDSARLYEELAQNGHRNAATKVAKFEREVAPKIVNLPPPKVEIPEINTIPPMRDNGVIYHGEQEQNYQSSQMEASAPKRNKRKSGHSLPELPRDTGTLLAPTELEQSVSATLLKLASTPSRLYNGISSLFGSSRDTGMDDSNNGGMMGSKRNSTSLLEDDEEDEISMEMRMRGMRGGRPSNRSLLEDEDEDSEQRGAMVGKRSKGSLLDDEDEDDSFRGNNSNAGAQPLWARR